MNRAMVKIGTLISVMFVLVGCSPINYFTRVKKTPDEYSRNYCCGEVSVPKSMDKRNPWVVYSDRDKNATYYNPGGKVQLKEALFMEAFAVIGEKGEYLKLVKYAPDNFENGRIKDRSKAEYYGWMHKDNLVLTSRSATDVATGYVIKMITMMKDTIPLQRSEDFFSDNSVVLYQEPELLNPINKVPFQQPIFLLKKSADKRKSFVIGKERFSSEEVGSMVAGWVSSSLLMPLGEYLYLDYKSLPIKKAMVGNSTAIPYKSEDVVSVDLPDFRSLNPVYSLSNKSDSMATIRTSMSVPLMNDKRNMVFSLSGKPIYRSMYDKLYNDRRQINIMLVFSDQRQVYDKFAQLASSFQQLGAIIKKYSGECKFRLGYLVGYENGKENRGFAPLSENIDSVLTSLERYADVQSSHPVSFGSDAWLTLKRSLSMLSNYKDESNLIVLIGENGNMKSQVEQSLVDKLVNTNSRIVGCQLYSNQGNTFNNFVLQVEDMISRSATQLGHRKRNYLVHSEQLATSNQYREISENIYALDYPQNSMWQGWILFPKKKEALPPDMLVSVIDSIMSEIVVDNNDLLSRIQNSFKSAGVGRTSLNPSWLKLNNISVNYEVSPNLFQPLATLNPYTKFPLKMWLNRTDIAQENFILFLTESELNRIKTYIKDVTKVRVDYKYSSSRKAKKRKEQSCLNLFEQPNPSRFDSIPRLYLNTSKSRRSMVKAFLYWAKEEKVYPKKSRELKRMSLSQNQQIICSFPSFNRLLGAYTLKDIKKKKMVTDRELDELQEYFLHKQKMLDEAIVASNRFEFNGQVYYRIESVCLP